MRRRANRILARLLGRLVRPSGARPTSSLPDHHVTKPKETLT